MVPLLAMIGTPGFADGGCAIQVARGKRASERPATSEDCHAAPQSVMVPPTGVCRPLFAHPRATTMWSLRALTRRGTMPGSCPSPPSAGGRERESGHPPGSCRSRRTSRERCESRVLIAGVEFRLLTDCCPPHVTRLRAVAGWWPVGRCGLLRARNFRPTRALTLLRDVNVTAPQSAPAPAGRAAPGLPAPRGRVAASG